MMRFLAAVAGWIGLFVIVIHLSGCMSFDAKYLECLARDNTSRPCQ